jgi:WD40 repeat protein
LTFSPDSRLVAAGADTKIELWGVSSRHLTSLETNGSVMAIAFSRDGAFIAAVTDNAGVQVWDVRTHRLSRTFTESSPGEANGTVAFSPNGSLLAVGTQDGAQLWDLATGHLMTTLKSGAGDSVASVAFSPDGRELAAGTVGVQLWNVRTRQLMTTLRLGDSNNVPFSLAFSSDGSRLTIGISGTEYQLWNVASGQRIASFNYNGDSLAVSPDFSLAASTTQDGTLQLANVAAKSVLDGPAANLPSADPDDVFSIAFSPNGHLLAAGIAGVGGGGDGGVGHGIRLWNVAWLGRLHLDLTRIS